MSERPEPAPMSAGSTARAPDLLAECERLEGVNKELVAALEGIFAITDRDHVAWHKAHAAIARARASETGR